MLTNVPGRLNHVVYLWCCRDRALRAAAHLKFLAGGKLSENFFCLSEDFRSKMQNLAETPHVGENRGKSNHNLL